LIEFLVYMCAGIGTAVLAVFMYLKGVKHGMKIVKGVDPTSKPKQGNPVMDNMYNSIMGYDPYKVKDEDGQN